MPQVEILFNKLNNIDDYIEHANDLGYTQGYNGQCHGIKNISLAISGFDQQYDSVVRMVQVKISRENNQAMASSNGRLQKNLLYWNDTPKDRGNGYALLYYSRRGMIFSTDQKITTFPYLDVSKITQNDFKDYYYENIPLKNQTILYDTVSLEKPYVKQKTNIQKQMNSTWILPIDINSYELDSDGTNTRIPILYKDGKYTFEIRFWYADGEKGYAYNIENLPYNSFYVNSQAKSFPSKPDTSEWNKDSKELFSLLGGNFYQQFTNGYFKSDVVITKNIYIYHDSDRYETISNAADSYYTTQFVSYKNILLPPILESSQPAFIYSSKDQKIYFSLSSLQTPEDIGHYVLKIADQANNKTAFKYNKYSFYNNMVVSSDGDLYVDKSSVQYDIDKQKYYISLPSDVIKWIPDKYYKVQMRTGSETLPQTLTEFGSWKGKNITENRFSEWSTIMALKTIQAPEIKILNNNYINEKNTIGIEKLQNPIFIGQYKCNSFENVDKYKFDLYEIKEKYGEESDEFLETSGWVQNNVSNQNGNNTDQSILTQNSYTFKTNLESKNNKKYKVIYSIITENGYQGTSPFYIFQVSPFIQEALKNFNFNYQPLPELGGIMVKLEYNSNPYNPIELPIGNYVLVRLSEKTNFKVAEDIKYIYQDNDKNAEITYLDLTVESGVRYLYGIQFIDDTGERSQREILPVEQAVSIDLQHLYLYSNNNSLAIKFNPRINSIKQNALFQKQDTLGSKYPIIFRNGVVNYKEFQLNGLISLAMDEEHSFFKMINQNYCYNDEIVIDKDKIYEDGWIEVVTQDNNSKFVLSEDNKQWIRDNLEEKINGKIKSKYDIAGLIAFATIYLNNNTYIYRSIIKLLFYGVRNLIMKDIGYQPQSTSEKAIESYLKGWLVPDDGDLNKIKAKWDTKQTTGYSEFESWLYQASLPYTIFKEDDKDSNEGPHTEQNCIDLMNDIVNNLNLQLIDTTYTLVPIYTFNTDLIDNNIYAERIFREKVLEFLNDGKYKLLRSPTEGNLGVILSNINLTPVQELNRMLYEFTADVCEIFDPTYDEMRKYGVHDIGHFTEKKELQSKTKMFQFLLHDNFSQENLFNLLKNKIKEFTLDNEGVLINPSYDELISVDNFTIEICPKLNLYLKEQFITLNTAKKLFYDNNNNNNIEPQLYEQKIVKKEKQGQIIYQVKKELSNIPDHIYPNEIDDNETVKTQRRINFFFNRPSGTPRIQVNNNIYYLLRDQPLEFTGNALAKSTFLTQYDNSVPLLVTCVCRVISIPSLIISKKIKASYYDYNYLNGVYSNDEYELIKIYNLKYNYVAERKKSSGTETDEITYESFEDFKHKYNCSNIYKLLLYKVREQLSKSKDYPCKLNDLSLIDITEENMFDEFKDLNISPILDTINYLHIYTTHPFAIKLRNNPNLFIFNNNTYLYSLNKNNNNVKFFSQDSKGITFKNQDIEDIFFLSKNDIQNINNPSYNFDNSKTHLDDSNDLEVRDAIVDFEYHLTIYENEQEESDNQND